MLPDVAQRRLTLAMLVGIAVVALAWLGWFAWRSPHSRFLPPHGAAAWIHYPVPPQIAIVADRYERRTVFRRSFELEAAPASARLRVRAFKGCSINLNGHPIDLPAAEQWNQFRTADVAAQLQAGTNDIRAVVANDDGPPVLWLSLEGPGWSVASDERWNASLDGAIECSARVAGQPQPLRRGNLAEGGNRTVESLQGRLPTLLLFALLSAGILFIAHVAARHQASFRIFGYVLSPLAAGLLVASLLWVLLLGHNALDTPLYPCGFDHAWHLKYIQYIQQHKSIPLADEGWEMYQPPLFYLLAACLLGMCKLSALDPGALLLLRLMGLIIGLAQLALVAACMRLLFPAQPRRQLAGLALAAFLPAPIYLCHYITNDALMMMLGTASVYLCLRVLRDEQPSAARHALLGLCLGAALLTKVTAVVVIGVVLLVVAGRLVARRERAPGVWLRSVGVTLVVTMLVSGWHYGRVWAHFGAPLAGNFGSLPEFRWWQDPGYGTFAYLFHFGRSLADPFFSAFYGLPDGLYSTLWGDGLCGGVGTWSNRPPWNYDLMAAGYLLALVPSLTIVIGLFMAFVQLLRRPQAEWFLLLGVAGGLTVAMLYQVLRYPYYCMANARHLSIGVVALCALGAWGLDSMSRLGRVPGTLLAILLGTWAWTAYSALWIQADAATHNWAGLQLRGMMRLHDAEVQFRKAMAADPHSVPARLNEAGILVQARQKDEARRLIEEVLRDDANNPDALFGLAIFFQAAGRSSEALDYLRRARELAPDYPGVSSILGGLLMGQNQADEAITAYRQALRVNPSSPSDHANLGLLLARTGKIEEALAQYRQALQLRPDHPGWLADLAWILATQEQSRLRNPPEALRLAEEACQRTGYRDAASLQSLAAAQAAGGRYGDARDMAQRALQVAASTGQADLVTRIEEQMHHYEKAKPFSARAPLRDLPYAPVLPRAVDE